MNKQIDQTISENAHKFTFLVKEYPDKTLEELTQLMNMPGIDVNLAIWHAVDADWIIEPEPDSNKIYLGKQPEIWNFGAGIAELEEKLLLAFNTLAKKEMDLQWEFISNWLMGYAPRDVMIVLKKMLAEGTLSKYRLTDPKDNKSVYDFYTLPENRQHLWGAKAFKIQPTEETPEPDKKTNDNVAKNATDNKE